jgi:hypothetical protein
MLTLLVSVRLCRALDHTFPLLASLQSRASFGLRRSAGQGHSPLQVNPCRPNSDQTCRPGLPVDAVVLAEVRGDQMEEAQLLRARKVFSPWRHALFLLLIYGPEILELHSRQGCAEWVVDAV